LPESEKIEIGLADDDFVDAEFWRTDGDGLVIITHGLEGSSKAVYVRALAKSYLEQGWNVLAWNFRGCSGRLNKKERLYHSGAYEDLMEVIQYCDLNFKPGKIHLAGFSLGGNMTLLCLAKENAWLKARKIEKAIVISPPINLAASSRKLENWWNLPYQINFLRDLKAKILRKEEQHQGHYKVSKLSQCKTVFDFDDAYTGPLHGFEGASDYYKKCSSVYFLQEIEIPTMVIVAENDPMLARGNYEEVKNQNPNLNFLFLKEGGHCGFWGMNVY